ncbi:hypothetical protein, partial [Mycobacterium tuberculosis]
HSTAAGVSGGAGGAGGDAGLLSLGAS